MELLAGGAPEAWPMFRRWHLPVLLCVLALSFLSPLSWILSAPPGWKTVAAPALAALGGLIVAWTFDRLLQYGQPPAIERLDQAPIRNVAIYLQLPAIAAGVFAFIHPLLGAAAVVMAVIYSLWLSIGILARLYERSRARVVTALLGAATMLLIPLVLLLAALNLMNTLRLWRAYS